MNLKKKRRKQKNDPKPTLDKYAFQLSEGVDLMEVDGIGRSLVLTIISETGLDLCSKFPNEKHYVSWLALCPNKKTSGGKTISSRTRKTKNNCAAAYRQAALNLAKRKDCALAKFYHTIAYRSSKKAAITATARKLAVIVYKMLETKQSYNPQDVEKYQEEVRKRKIKSIQKAMKKMNIKLEEIGVA